MFVHVLSGARSKVGASYGHDSYSKIFSKTTALVDHDQAALLLVFTPVIPLFVRLNKQGLGHEPQEA